MGMIKRIDHTGDSLLAEWDKTDPASVEEVRKIFDTLVTDPATNLARIEDATKNIAVKTSTFDPEAEQIIVWGQIAGG